MKTSISAVASTAISGLSNVILQLFAARLLSAEEYAKFAIAAATILFFVGLSRTLVGQTDLIRGDRESDRGVVAAAFVLALFSGVIGIALALVNAVSWDDTLFIIGIALLVSPCFILQDSARFRAFRVARSHWALVSDLVAFLLTAGLFLGFTERWSSAVGLLLVWGGTTGVGFVILVRPLHYVARLEHSAAWCSSNRDLLIPGGLEYLLQTTVPYLLNWVILIMGGAGALAGYRIVQLIFGSLGNLAQGSCAFELPRISASPTRRSIVGFLVRNALVLAIPAIVLYIVIDYLPDESGTAVFGDSWRGVPTFLLAGAIHGFVNALLVSSFQAIRILGEARYSLVVRVVTVMLIPVVSLWFGTMYGAVGIAWGLALVTLLGYIARLARIVERVKGLEGL